MSLERTPPSQALELAPTPREDIPSASNQCNDFDRNCLVCKEIMLDNHDCLILTNCNHIFHRTCIENSLSQAAECPICHRPCQLVDFKKINLLNLAKQNNSQKGTINSNVRGKGRGAMSKRYNTRNVTKSLFQENTLVDCGQMTQPFEDEQPSATFTPNRTVPTVQNNFQSTQPSMADVNNQNFNISSSQLTQIIETSVVKILQSLNVVSNNTQTHNVNTCNQNVNNQQIPNTSRNTPLQPTTNTSKHINHFPFSLSHTHNTNQFNIHADKITSIIQNWNLKFDGSANGLSVDEFLYRIRSLTAENFNNDFSIICRNLHILLSGKARDWYWRFHKQVDNIEWSEFCAAIKYQYKDFKTNFDLREDLRNRKMKAGETFDTFFEAISAIIDRLDSQIAESELIEILTKNLRPDIRHELLYVPIYSVAHLRKCVQMRENLMSDEYFRKNVASRTLNQSYPKRNVAELDLTENSDIFQPSDSVESNIDAIQYTNNSKCWNCDCIGHNWQDCLSERTIFCYGCGTKNMYKPQCPKCSSKLPSNKKNYQRPTPPPDKS